MARVEISSPVASRKVVKRTFLFRRRDGELQRIGELIACIQLNAIFPRRPTFIGTRKCKCTERLWAISSCIGFIHFVIGRRDFADIFGDPNATDFVALVQRLALPAAENFLEIRREARGGFSRQFFRERGVQ